MFATPSEDTAMKMLYDSDRFVVVHIVVEQTSTINECGMIRTKPEWHGFEIVDKRSNKEVFLHGNMAEYFTKMIRSWQDEVPTQVEVEEMLDGITTLATIPLLMH